MPKIIYPFLVLLLSLASCATIHRTKDLHESSSSFLDSTRQTVLSGVVGDVLSTDSLLSIFLQASASRQLRNDSTNEQITETITTYIDSLGREVRQEQRTISRSESRTIELYFQHQISRLQQEYSRQLSRYDSLFQSLYENKKSQQSDSLSSEEKKEVSNPFYFLLILKLVALALSAIVYCLYKIKKNKV